MASGATRSSRAVSRGRRRRRVRRAVDAAHHAYTLRDAAIADRSRESVATPVDDHPRTARLRNLRPARRRWFDSLRGRQQLRRLHLAGGSDNNWDEPAGRTRQLAILTTSGEYLVRIHVTPARYDRYRNPGLLALCNHPALLRLAPTTAPATNPTVAPGTRLIRPGTGRAGTVSGGARRQRQGAGWRERRVTTPRLHSAFENAPLAGSIVHSSPSAMSNQAPCRLSRLRSSRIETQGKVLRFASE